MDAILDFFTFLQGFGVTVIMPVIITIIGVIMGCGFGKSLRAGLTVGVGFVGLNLVINNLMGASLAPAVQTMVDNYGLSLNIIDVGWPASSAIAMGSTIGLIIIPLGLLVNIIMLLTNTTQTVDVDIWNYWHFAFTGSLVGIITGNLALGVVAAVVNMVIVLVIGDVTAPLVEESLGLPGVSIPHGFSAAFAPIAYAINWIIEKIPGLNKIDINMEKAQKRFGVFGEPILVGTVIGIVIAALAGYPIQKIFITGVEMGAVLVLIPKMAALLMEGLLPISDAASGFIQRKFKNRGRIYIGLDSAVGVGHPVTLSLALILVPLMIFLAVIVPGNQVLPFTDLAVVPYMFVLITPIVKQNGFRGLIVGIVVLALGLLMATNLAPAFTEVAATVGFKMPEGATMISSICDGANPLSWILVRLHDFGYIGTAIGVVSALALAIWNRARILKQAKTMHE